MKEQDIIEIQAPINPSVHDALSKMHQDVLVMIEDTFTYMQRESRSASADYFQALHDAEKVIHSRLINLLSKP